MKKVMDDPVTITGRIVATRGFEILIDTRRKDKAHWLPKDSVRDNQNGTFTMERWMAFERGLI